MRIFNLSLINFRNYEKLSIKFNDNINIFIGNNGEGKTNILESIYVLAITKSHRSYIDKNLITNNKNILKINGRVNSNNEIKDMELVMNSKGKRVSINRIVSKRISDYISNLIVILFCPDDLDIIKGSPNIRRKYLNIEIGQIDNKYLYYLNEYNQLLKTRNEYLKTCSIDKINENYINVITSQLCEKASIIYEYRFEYVNNLNNYIKDIYSSISQDEVRIRYVNSLGVINFDDSMKNMLNDKLKDCLKRDVFSGSTSYGPHKDDFEILFNDVNVRDYGSQGQQRLSVLYMKFAELELIKNKKGEYPLLLLDDIFSELDINNRNKIINYLNKDIQVFITSTDINDIEEKIIKNAQVFKIKDKSIV